MADLAITRRGIVGAMMIAPVVVAAPVSAQINSDFGSKLAAYRAAERAERNFDATTYKEASERFDHMEAAIPHQSVEWSGGPNAKSKIWSTADNCRVREAKYFLDPKHSRPIDPSQANYHAACVELTAAVAARRVLLLRASKESGLDAAGAESDRLCDVRCAARDAVVHHPVRSAAELSAKIAIIRDNELWDSVEVQDIITADVTRIARA
ncbi:hypothetical protein [Sphingomonas sp. Marseille-Q8236]